VGEAPCTGQGGEAVLKAENAAVEMYRFAALMLGNENQAMELVENTVAQVDIDPCADPCAVKGLVRERVLDGALEIMHRHDPASFSAPLSSDRTGSCIEDDSTVPLSGEEISHLVESAGRGPLRAWLERLSQAQRAVFVQRAVLGSSNADTARAINRYSRPSIWTAEAVSNLFRQALCSLASSLLHSAPAAQV
jgi:DNA-directed RNA polymerase sigma subunit (sigma70/sigma32)